MSNISERCSRGHSWEETAVYFPGRPLERVCSECRKINTQRWRDNNRQKVRELDKQYRADNLTKHKLKDKKSYEKHREDRLAADKDYYWNGGGKDKSRWRVIKKRYGITKEEFNAVFESQNRACAICGKTDFTEWTLNIDHDHKTGKFRGILCNNCNMALGLMRDDIELLENAIKYISSKINS